MNFWDKITGNDIRRDFKKFESRVEKLPNEYKEAWKGIEENLWQHSDFTGRNLIPVLEEALVFLEETSADGQKIEEVLGNDINGFCLELVGEEKANDYRSKWRRQLNKNIEKKLNK
ncbi:MAG: DUF1048 domain-containing protein [Clostridium sp.]